MNKSELIEASKNYTVEKERLDERKNGRIAFLEKFPLESLKDMMIDEYVLGTDENSFCYWLEFKKSGFGIGGGNSSKFGIYKTKVDEELKYVIGTRSKKSYLDKELSLIHI